MGCAYVSGLGAGDTVACREPFHPHARLGRLQMISTITQVCWWFEHLHSGDSYATHYRDTVNLGSAPSCSWFCISVQWLRSLGGLVSHHLKKFIFYFKAFYFISLGLALAWLLASGFKWGHEAIEAVSAI